MDMTKPEADCGLTMISPTSFFSSEREKTKLNWFTYELAMSIYDEARRGLGKRLRREGVGGDALAEISIHAAKALRDQVRPRLAGKLDGIVISYELVQDRHGGLNDKTLNGMVDAMMRAWDEVLSICEVCSIRCITEHDRRCEMFDLDLSDDAHDICLRKSPGHGGTVHLSPGALRVGPSGEGPRLVHDNVLGRLMDRVEAWCVEFPRSEQFARLTAEQQAQAEFIVTSFARYMYTELGFLPGSWGAEAVEKGCVDILPTKVTAELSCFMMVAPVLAAFLEFADEKGLVLDGKALAARVAPLGNRIVANASDPSRWGMAKSLVMAALEAGVDPTDEKAMNRFAARHHGRSAGRRRGEARRRGGPGR